MVKRRKEPGKSEDTKIMKKHHQLKKQHKIASVLMIFLVIIAVFFTMYYVGNGFSTNDKVLWDNDDVKVMLTSPDDTSLFHSNEDIHVSGSVYGGIPDKVMVWDARYNVPVYATIQGTTFGVMLYAEDLANGVHTLCIQAHTTDGRWTPIKTVTVEFYGTTGPSDTVQQQTWSETYLPDPIAVIFRPIEEVITQTVVYVTSGTSSDDLNGDNVPDELTQSPTTPRYNPMNIPLTFIIVFVLLIILVLIILLKIVKPYLQRKHQYKQEILRSPEKREWVSQQQRYGVNNLKNQLNSEKNKRKKLEKKVSQLQKQPINIYVDGKKKQR